MNALNPFDDILALWGTNYNSQASKYFASPTTRELLTFDVGLCDAVVEARKTCLGDNDAYCQSFFNALSCTFEFLQAGDKVASGRENYYHTPI